MPLNLRNPHSVLALIDDRPQDLLELILPPDRTTPAWEQVREAAADLGIVPSARPREERQPRNRRDRGGRSGAAEAIVKDRDDVPLAGLFPENPTPGLWLALDTVQDPHNVGAIFRTSAFFGVRGIIIPRDRTSSMTGTVYDVASGGVEVVPFTLQGNLARALQEVKDRGYWILGSSEHAETPLAEVSLDRAWVLVVGNEEDGLRRLTLEACDTVCAIPALGPLGSLNVSVATGILIHHLASR